MRMMMTEMDLKKQAFFPLLPVKATTHNLYTTELNEFYVENLSI
jgi:hypothetical protein